MFLFLDQCDKKKTYYLLISAWPIFLFGLKKRRKEKKKRYGDEGGIHPSMIINNNNNAILFPFIVVVVVIVIIIIVVVVDGLFPQPKKRRMWNSPILINRILCIYVPVPTYRAFNCSAEILAPPGLLMMYYYQDRKDSSTFFALRDQTDLINTICGLINQHLSIDTTQLYRNILATWEGVSFSNATR